MIACFLPRWLGPRLIVVGVLLAAFAVHVGVAYADGGEAGLVIQHGDGSVDTYCVGFQGDSISGSTILTRVGISVVQFNGAVCAVGTQEGCFQPSSYDTCYCMSFPPTSTYWGFYTEPYGKQWQYSAVGFQDPHSILHDGDMQAWRWGKGGPNNAPPPVAISFEQVCGHAPRGGVQLEATAAATPTNPQLPTTAITQSVSSPTPEASPSAPTPLPPSTVAAPTDSPTAAIRNHGTATAVPQAPATGSTSGGGSSAISLIAFAAIAIALLGVIGGALLWRRRHGA